jgi:hypothetical protein
MKLNDTDIVSNEFNETNIYSCGNKITTNNNNNNNNIKIYTQKNTECSDKIQCEQLESIEECPIIESLYIPYDCEYNWMSIIVGSIIGIMLIGFLIAVIKFTDWITEMKANGVEDWYIGSCKKIKYMFPKAHAVAYVMMAVRIAWFKVHEPLYYYCMFFSIRCDAYDIETMIKGEASIRAKMAEIDHKLHDPQMKKDVTKKDKDTYSTLELALEMHLRGFYFSNIDLMRSDAKEFIVDKDNKNHIIPPFSCIDGLGESVAVTIVEARKEREFISKEDLLKRTSLSSTLLKKLESMGVLEGMQEENQLSLFSF